MISACLVSIPSCSRPSTNSSKSRFPELSLSSVRKKSPRVCLACVVRFRRLGRCAPVLEDLMLDGFQGFFVAHLCVHAVQIFMELASSHALAELGPLVQG
eukprot:TRINITY_DN2699_c0_g1_i7.p1 TRINITY_DN2699_c0_g1~~TRINITY_DN2699_c0_g1_i7.p1  ORF type:complete len:100 (+),score=7.20 TRINITY_DN2699_c0_g1_i7:842-1141(+)